MMSEVNFTQGSYVIAKNVPVNVDDVNNGDILTDDFPVQRPTIVRCPGNGTALLICWSDEDAEELIEYEHPKGVTFERYTKQHVIKWPTLKVDKNVIDTMKLHGDLDDFRRSLNDAQIQLHEGDCYIRTPSRLQIEYSKHLLSKYQQKHGLCDDVANIKIDEKLLTLTLSGIDGLTWELVDIVRNMDIIQLKLNGGSVEYTDRTVKLSASKQEAKAIANGLNSFIADIKDKEKEKIDISNSDQANAANCCREVNELFGKSCCALAPSKEFIIIYDGTCDGLQQIKLAVSRKLSISRRKLRSSQSTQSDTLPDETNGLESNANNRNPYTNFKDFNWVKDAKHVKSFSTSEGILVYVYSADVFNLPVDCIVLAADDELRYSSGIGKTVSKAAGPKLKQECKEYIANVGNIPTGHVAVTGAGDLQYDCIIHAVVPAWSTYKPHTQDRVMEAEQHLLSAIMQSFFKAETRGLESVGIVGPLSDLPEGLSVHQCVRATMDYSSQSHSCSTALKEIHFIDTDSSNLALLQVKLATFINEGKDPNYSVENFVKVRILPGKSRRSSKRLSRADD